MNIFIANLSFRTKEEQLRKSFEHFGEVTSAKIVTDRYTRRSKGYGFVEMPNDSEAIKAIQKLHETNVDGNQIVVKKSNPRNSNN